MSAQDWRSCESDSTVPAVRGRFRYWRYPAYTTQRKEYDENDHIVCLKIGYPMVPLLFFFPSHLLSCDVPCEVTNTQRAARAARAACQWSQQGLLSPCRVFVHDSWPKSGRDRPKFVTIHIVCLKIGYPMVPHGTPPFFFSLAPFVLRCPV